ncbi:MAG: winged helix-turn-helix domain-containing protein [Sphingomonas sp.]|nr:winged helix-turn-helix domain-containing protein [Sphingomonas sp.]
MNERVEMPTVPAWLAALPFLFSAGRRTDPDVVLSSTLASAASAMAADPDRCDGRSRISFLLAELGSQYGRRTDDHSAWIPVTRAQLSRAAQINLTKVKRVLGFLLLSGVIDLGTKGIRILDWNRLCKLGCYDRSWVPVPQGEEIEPAPAVPTGKEKRAPAITASGDPASFV